MHFINKINHNLLKPDKSGRTGLGIYLALCTVLYVYLWFRAAFVPMAHDEIATFFHFVHTGKFLPFHAIWDANNHLLNSVITWISYHIFGSSPLALRLSNLIFVPLFFYYIYRISKYLHNDVIRWTFLISLCFSHYFIEFFALSRGYGMSMALMSGAIFHLIKTFNSDQIKDYALTAVFIILMLLANLSLLIPAIAIAGYQILYFFTRPLSASRKTLSKVLIIILLEMIPLLIFTILLLKMKGEGALYYGTTEGFWKITIKTLVPLLTGMNNLTVYILLILTFTFSLFTFFFLSLRISSLFLPWRVFPILLFTSFAGVMLASSLFDVNFPEDRVGLYFFPLFAGSVFFSADTLFKKYHNKLIFLTVLPFLFFPVHFLGHLNFAYSNCYKVDVVPERFYHKVKESHIPGQPPPTVGGYRTRHFCWSYHDFRNSGDQSQLYFNSYPGLQSDFQIVDITDNPSWLSYYDMVDRDNVTGRYLLKRKQKITSLAVKEISEITTHGDISKEYHSLFEADCDTLTGLLLYLTYDLTIYSPVIPFVGWVVLEIQDSEHNNLTYESFALDWQRSAWDGSFHNFINGQLTGKIPDNAHRIIVYIWNIDKMPYRISDGKIILNKLVPDFPN